MIEAKQRENYERNKKPRPIISKFKL